MTGKMCFDSHKSYGYIKGDFSCEPETAQYCRRSDNGGRMICRRFLFGFKFAVQSCLQKKEKHLIPKNQVFFMVAGGGLEPPTSGL